MTRIRTIDVPQANTLGLVGELIALLDAGIEDSARLSRQLGIVRREVDYYKHAARILGFVRLRNSRAVMTDRGRAYLQAKRPGEKVALLVEAVRETVVFRELLQRYTEPELSRANIIDFLKDATDLSGTTVGRRADTITAWLKTISKFDPEDFRSLATYASARGLDLFREYERREEGLLHRNLKERIRDNPQALLGEPLTLVKEEYQFPTGDRVDLLFIDARARFLAVEVEVDVGAHDVVGLLQAVKYRAMLVVQFGRRPSGARALLAARSIHPVMQQRAERYEVETREVGHGVSSMGGAEG